MWVPWRGCGLLFGELGWSRYRCSVDRYRANEINHWPLASPAGFVSRANGRRFQSQVCVCVFFFKNQGWAWSISINSLFWGPTIGQVSRVLLGCEPGASRAILAESKSPTFECLTNGRKNSKSPYPLETGKPHHQALKGVQLAAFL